MHRAVCHLNGSDEAQGSALVIQITSCRMPRSFWNTYVNIKLIEVEGEIFDRQRLTRKARRITTRTFSQGVGVIHVHYFSERNHLGKTARSAAGRQVTWLVAAALQKGRVPHIISCRSALPLAEHLYRNAVVVGPDECIVVEQARVGVESYEDAILLKMSGRAEKLFSGDAPNA